MAFSAPRFRRRKRLTTDLAVASEWANEWSNVAPADNNLFPVLRLQDADLQAAAIADGLVELQSFFGDDIAILDYRSVNTIAPTVSIRLDANGAAAADRRQADRRFVRIPRSEFCARVYSTA